MVGIVLVTHSAALALAVKELAEQMVDKRVPIAPAGGIDDDEHPFGTDASRISAAIDSVFSEDGVLLLMDMGSSLISAELARDLLSEHKRNRVLLCEAPIVEGAVAAAVRSDGGGMLSEVAEEARHALSAKKEQLAIESSAYETSLRNGGDTTGGYTTGGDPDELHSEIAQKTAVPFTQNAPPGEESAGSIVLKVPNGLGFHARPASKFVTTASSFRSRISVQNITRQKGPVDARSINGLITLGVRGGNRIRISATGPDSDAALSALKNLVEAFDEEKLPAGTKHIQAQLPGLKAPDEIIEIKKGLQIRCIGTSPGIAVGSSFRFRPVFELKGTRTPGDPESEWSKLQNALQLVQKQITGMKERVLKEAGENEASIFDAHTMMLNDPALLKPVEQAIFSTSCTAEEAWKSAVDMVVRSYRADDSPYIRARETDLQDISSQVHRVLSGEGVVWQLPYPCIILAARLLPSDIAGLERKMILGVCAAYETANSHAMILLRSLDIPAATLTGIETGIEIMKVPDKTPLVLDADSGVLIVNPENTAHYKEAQKKWQITVVRERKEAAVPVVTADGKKVPVFANIGSVEEAVPARYKGADGIGVLRTEFLFLQRENPPSEDEQVDSYRAIGDAFQGLPVIVRTLDAGGDKPLSFLNVRAGDNPALGKRGIRLILDRPDILKTQFRAVLRVSAGSPTKIMLPMVTTIREVQIAEKVLRAAKEELQNEGTRFDPSTSMGIMIEVPAAALTSAPLARECDFLSLGTNDLSQYTLAADRTNPDVASLNDALHPALLRMIEVTVTAGHEAGIPVSVCGEIAADPEAVAVLLGLGVDALSMNPASIPHVKSVIRQIRITDAQHLADRVLRCSSAEEVREMIHGNPLTNS